MIILDIYQMSEYNDQIIIHLVAVLFVADLSVEVRPGEVAACVAHNDAVWVEHRHNLEDEQLPQSLGRLSVPGEVVQDT